MQGEKILMAGLTGMVAKPLAKKLAVDNEVWGVARFTNPDARAQLEAAGVHCVAADLVDGDLSGLPDDFTYGLNFAVTRTGDWETDIDGNSVGTARFMEKIAGSARAYLHCSSPVVYAYEGDQENRTRSRVETDPLGDRHRHMPGLETYAIGKILSEGAARIGARLFDLPTTIARINVPYGEGCIGLPGMHLKLVVDGTPVPVYPDGPNRFNPIHDDDIAGQVPGLLAIASVPAITINWGGKDEVTVEEYTAYFGELLGRDASTVDNDVWGVRTAAMDMTKLHELVGPTKVEWKDGMRRMVEGLYPELVKP